MPPPSPQAAHSGNTPPVAAAGQDGTSQPDPLPPTPHHEGKKFLKGVAISVWQNSPDSGASQWTHFARRQHARTCAGGEAGRLLRTLLGGGKGPGNGGDPDYCISHHSDFWSRWECGNGGVGTRTFLNTMLVEYAAAVSQR